MNAMKKSELPAEKFIVRYRGYAVRFHTNCNGKVYSLVADKDATAFASRELADTSARHCNLKEYHTNPQSHREGFEKEDLNQ